MSKERCVVYSRVSSDSDRQNYESQTEELTEVAKNKNWDICGVFEEKISGTIRSQERKEFARMEEFIFAKNIKTVIIWEISRLSRTLRDSVDVIDNWNNRGINTYIKSIDLNTLNSDGTVNVHNMLSIHMLQSLAEYEIKQLKQRVIRGLKSSKLQGGASSVMPYGFKNIDKKIAPDKDELKVIKRIFKEYISGQGCGAIAKQLNHEGIQTRNNKLYGEKEIKTPQGRKRKGSSFKFSDTAIREIIKNPLYKGLRIHKEQIGINPETKKKITKEHIVELKELGIKPPISVNLWEKANSMMKAKANNNKETHFINCMKNKIFCGVCGEPYFQHARQSKKDWAYRCLSRRKRQYDTVFTKCESLAVNIDKTNNSIYYLLNSIEKGSVVNWETTLKKQISSLEFRIRECEEKLAEIEEKRKRIVNLYKMGRISDFEMDSEFTANDRSLAREEIRLGGLESELEDKKEMLIGDIGTKSINDIEAFKDNVKRWVKSIVVTPVTWENYSEIFVRKNSPTVSLSVKLVDDQEHEIILSAYSYKAIVNGTVIDLDYSIKIDLPTVTNGENLKFDID